MDFTGRSAVAVTGEGSWLRHLFVEFDCDDPAAEFPAAVPLFANVKTVLDQGGDLSTLMGANIRGWAQINGW